jgi:outer membrane protein OmpA-like peptidoglycan-associated protein
MATGRLTEFLRKLETHMMPQIRVRSHSGSPIVVAALALTFSVLPLGAALAQVLPIVQVTRKELKVTSSQHEEGGLLTTAQQGTELEVIYTDGDRYTHRESNWYWVLLPRDAWGTRHVGWVSGRDVEFVSRPEPPKPAASLPVGVPVVNRVAVGPAAAPVVAEPPPPVAPPAAPERMAEMVLNFDFGKSELTEDSRRKLAAAAALLKTAGQSVSFDVEGHADWIGTEGFNEKLGQARAETVKRHLVQELQIAADRIGVISYGESKPAVPNTTPEGRAQNRRVVVKAN